jgi:hypothetical protein
VLWIRDILVRILIRGFVQLTYGSGSGSCFFHQWLKISFFEGTFTSVFKDKKSKRSHNIAEIKVFLTVCLLMEGGYSGGGLE